MEGKKGDGSSIVKAGRFIPRGEAGAFDWGGVYCEYPAIGDDQLYFMYTGESTRHGISGLPSFGLATLRLDGFVSVETVSFMAGTLVTRPHHWNAAEVRVNVQSPTGGLKVQLQDETGRAFGGFGAEDCEPIVEDALDAPVRWRGSGDVRSLSGKMVVLQFSFLPEDKLYSYMLRVAS